MSDAVPGAPTEILLVDDDAADVRLTFEAFKRINLPVRLSVARDGVEAIDFVRKRGRFAEARMPDLILLDLNMPRKNGYEVLAEIKADPQLRHIPVVVLTTSSADEDVLRSYQLHGNCYLTKPVELDRFVRIIEALGCFWLTLARLPRCQEGPHACRSEETAVPRR